MSGQGQPRILYVDDDPTNRRTFSWILRAAGYAVKEAGSGTEALRLVSEQPDLVILDVSLPDVNGFEVCRRIKAHPATTRIPVLHLSGVFVRTEDRSQALEGGADGYLLKPAEPREVLATVKALLRVHEAEEAARTAAREWQATFEALSDAVCLLDAGGRVLRGNQALAQLLGRSAEALLGQPCAALFQQTLGTPLIRRFGQSPVEPVGTATSWDELFARVRVDGERRSWELTAGERWLFASADPVLDDDGNLTGTVHLFADITERKHTEEERTRLLAERVQLMGHLQLLMESTGEGIFGLDLEGRCTFINRAAAQFLGYPPDELVGRPLQPLVAHTHADGSPCPPERCAILQAMRSGRGFRMDNAVFWRRDGTSFPVEYSCHPIREGETIRGAVVTFFDVTDRRRLEEHLRQAQKMEAVGRLAGGIAHDFNNLLAVITGNLSLVLTALPADDPQHGVLKTIDRAAWRAADLVRQLLGFSRQTMLWLQPTSLNPCVEEVVNILARTIDPRIVVEVDCQDGLWPVKADPGQLNQVLMNLCLNARDAMTEGGRLRLETRNVTLDEAAVPEHPGARAGEFVRLRVADTGSGIAPDVLPRIFDPYFTTKEQGKGTGLGLAMVFGIVQQHQGWIECVSTPHQGSCFDVYLPRLPLAPSEPAPAGVPAPPARGQETVLLVDDDAMLRRVGQAILEKYGYRVLLAEDGLQAVDLYQQSARIDLVLLDMTMPRLSGRDTLARLRQLDPEVAVVLMSGYTADRDSVADPDHILGFLPKPYRESDLAAAVRSALDRRLATA